MSMGGIGIWQLVIVLLIVFLLFGSKRLKSLGGDLGETIQGFRKSMATSDTDEQATAQVQQHVPAQAEATTQPQAHADRHA
ncbi:twin-arginine translocase TatA/TatE family subunit [Pseudomonas sp. UBA6323]|uniref:twin-arginine translocase TatA/TatE family subunit n=1 Tax=Pseudomonas sp. UBA6323 TaxID=1947329 RepID=UPI0025D1C166|nr:twin-arginine translocase TatA/TatE family subunit [Pseudomonas sp. UBA6323]